MMRYLFILLSLTTLLSSCKTHNTEISKANTPLEKEFEKDLRTQGIDQASIVVLDENAKVILKYGYGGIETTSLVAVDSASKWVSAGVILRLVQQGVLQLDTPIETYLKNLKNQPQGQITLRQALAFQSGYEGKIACSLNPFSDTKSCAEKLLAQNRPFKAGAEYDYGSSHLLIAAYVAEVVTGKKWQQIFNEQVVVPLGMKSSPMYYTFPKKQLGQANPLIAGGLNISAEDYSLFLSKILKPDSGFLNADLVAQMLKPQFNDKTIVHHSPMKEMTGVNNPYALGNWFEQNFLGQDYSSSAGWRGSFPWINLKKKYLAVITTNVEDGAKKSYKALKSFRPYLESHMD